MTSSPSIATSSARAGPSANALHHAPQSPASNTTSTSPKWSATSSLSSDTSKIREGYVGLLGYTVFAFLEGHENLPIQLEIQAPTTWPVFSTLAPQVPAATTTFTTQAANYYALADSQITLGPKIQITKRDAATPNSPTLFVSLYAERDSDIAVDAALARDALDKVTAYFGSAPFSHYSAVIEYLKPLPPPHVYNFSMEHLESGTFFMDTDYVMTEASSPAV